MMYLTKSMQKIMVFMLTNRFHCSYKEQNDSVMKNKYHFIRTMNLLEKYTPWVNSQYIIDAHRWKRYNLTLDGQLVAGQLQGLLHNEKRKRGLFK